MVLQLKENAAVFSAFKSHTQQKEIHSLLVDENNKQRSFDQFRTEALKVDSKYNQQWLSAEFDLATRQARSAKQWQEYESKKDLYPNLQYIPSRSAHQRRAHMKYYNLIFSIDDPIWDTIMPPGDWECKCGTKQTRDDVTNNDGIEPLEPIPGIAGNSGKSGTIFSASHPYVVNSSKIEKDSIKKQLPTLKEGNVELLNIKVGKNNLSISSLADQSDVIKNIDYIVPFIKKLKSDFTINAHSTEKKVKNPEYFGLKIRGDRTEFKGENIKSYVSRGFRKLGIGKQLGSDKKCFLGYDFNKKLTAENVNDVANQLNSKMTDYRNKLPFILLKNGEKILKLDNHKLLNTNDIIRTIKRELL